MSDSTIITLGPRERVFAEADAGEVLYLVLDGAVAITHGEGAAMNIFAVIGKGDFFGEMAVIDPAPRSAGAVAEADGAKLMLIDQACFLYLVS